MTSTVTQTTLRNLQQGDLQNLAESTGDPCVSILMPTHRKGREMQQDPIRWKNLLTKASESLEQAGHDVSILDRVASLQNDSSFWQNQGHGLAVFVSEDHCHLWRLNRTVDESVHVGTEFFMSPLIREHNAQGKHFVLAVSWDEATLYQCDGESLTIVETQRLPGKIDDLVLPRDPEESLQNTSHRSHGGASVGVFHGQGEGEDKIEADRNQYLSIVGDEVAGAIYNTGTPLVIVATSEVSGHFAATNSVEIAATVEASPSAMTEDELQQAAHDAIAPQLKTDQDDLTEQFGTALANSRASQELSEIMTAAKSGQVAALIVCDTKCKQTNRAVVETFQHGGDVFRCDESTMPGKDVKVAAIFRF